MALVAEFRTEPTAAVEIFQFIIGDFPDAPVDAEDAIEVLVVGEDHGAVLRFLDVNLDKLGALFDRLQNGGHGVLRCGDGTAAVGGDGGRVMQMDCIHDAYCNVNCQGYENGKQDEARTKKSCRPAHERRLLSHQRFRQGDIRPVLQKPQRNLAGQCHHGKDRRRDAREEVNHHQQGGHRYDHGGRIPRGTKEHPLQ